MASQALISDPEAALAALTPLRQRILAALREPGSAASLAETLSASRQQLGYHLKALEKAGLIARAGTRQRRGFIEQLFRACADDFVLDPGLMARSLDAIDAQDKHAASHLVGAAATLVREVTRMQSAAEAEGSRLLTFTIEAELGFADPAELDRFTTGLAEAISELAKKFPPGEGRRGYHLVAGAHPAAARGKTSTPN
ncbi:ArsR/SmtB family transcription factor [Cucumibacter marinus]|uniref:ArsR/SmtB family transcription factor n=1 Tax=Cucumibacter marinus TaxID=1121252 RepID=UPI000402B88A|nr:helix-turn-helix domain-containing protein [Cucumibacter marinus]